MTPAIHPVILRYAAGEIFASEAGLEPPSQPPEQARAELARARAILRLPEIQD